MSLTKNGKKSVAVKPKFLIFTHIIPYAPSAGNEIRLFNMLQWLRANDYEIIACLNVRKLEDKIRRQLATLIDHIYTIEDLQKELQFCLRL